MVTFGTPDVQVIKMVLPSFMPHIFHIRTLLSVIAYLLVMPY